MQIQIIDIQTQEIVAQGSVDQIKALYEEEEVLEAIDQAIETQETVTVYGFVGNGIEITATEESSNDMQQQQSPVAQMLMADSKKFECAFSEGDALVIPNNEIAYGKPLFRVTESEIFLLSVDGKIWDEYDMPEDGDVVSYIETLLSSFGL